MKTVHKTQHDSLCPQGELCSMVPNKHSLTTTVDSALDYYLHVDILLAVNCDCDGGCEFCCSLRRCQNCFGHLDLRYFNPTWLTCTNCAQHAYCSPVDQDDELSAREHRGEDPRRACRWCGGREAAQDDLCSVCIEMVQLHAQAHCVPGRHTVRKDNMANDTVCEDCAEALERQHDPSSIAHAA